MKRKFYNWFKYNKENNIVEVTKDKFPLGDDYINPENGWKRLESSMLEIKVG